MKDSSASKAVAIDLGASSMRYALGEYQDGQIRYEIIEQVPNAALETNGRWTWDADKLLDFCKCAESKALHTGNSCTIGIDSWGVDHGFIGFDGSLIQQVVAYRDPSHVRCFDRLSPNRYRLFELTGIQHQPFNTIYQLAARMEEDPDLRFKAKCFLLLPDLLNYLLTGKVNCEFTQCSTTQLMGLDGKWCEEAFRLIDWPLPNLVPAMPGQVIGATQSGVPVVSVGSHDTASGVCGLGSLTQTTAFLNVGTWTLLGSLVDQPITNSAAQSANFTNERAVDGRVRFLDNIPGFYVANRLYDELQIARPLGEWLAHFEPSYLDSADLFHATLYNPRSMSETLVALVDRPPSNEAEFAALALNSMSAAIDQQLCHLEKATGERMEEIRAGGGGSGSATLCQMLADRLQRPIVAGPQEATLLGNLGMQFLSQGVIDGFEDLAKVIDRSTTHVRYEPQGTV